MVTQGERRERVQPRTWLWRDRELGLWYLCQLRWLRLSGATPRNAGSWSAYLDVGRWDGPRELSLWLSLGSHPSVQVWRGKRQVWCWMRAPRGCACLACRIRGDTRW